MGPGFALVPMQATPGRDKRSYHEIQKYLQSDYSASSLKMDDDSCSTMTRVLARLNRSQATQEPGSETKKSDAVTRRLFTRRASATAEYTDMLQQRALSQLSLSSQDGRASVSSQGQGQYTSEDEVVQKYLGKKRGSVSVSASETGESLVKAGVLKSLRGKLATTEQKLRVVQSDLVTKCDEVRKLLAKVNRLEKEKSRALQSQIDALPKSMRKNRKASIWSKLEMDTKKRDARFSQILQHYEILEGQYNESLRTREDLEESLGKTRSQLNKTQAENATLREELVSMTMTEQKSRLEFLECMKSLQDVRRSHESSQNECRQMKEVIETQNATIASQGGDLDKLRALQERTLKEKVKKDHKIAALQKKLARREQEIEVLKKTQDTCESDYYNLEDRMKLLRKRNSFLEVNLDKANKTSDAAKKTVEMKEEECRLMASIIHDTRRATVSNTTTYAPQFSAPAYDNHDTEGGRGGLGAGGSLPVLPGQAKPPGLTACGGGVPPEEDLASGLEKRGNDDRGRAQGARGVAGQPGRRLSGRGGRGVKSGLTHSKSCDCIHPPCTNFVAPGPDSAINFPLCGGKRARFSKTSSERASDDESVHGSFGTVPESVVDRVEESVHHDVRGTGEHSGDAKRLPRCAESREPGLHLGKPAKQTEGLRSHLVEALLSATQRSRHKRVRARKAEAVVRNPARRVR